MLHLIIGVVIGIVLGLLGAKYLSSEVAAVEADVAADAKKIDAKL